jgi:hypothetical protein
MAVIDLYGRANIGVNWQESIIPEIINLRDTYATSSEFGVTADLQLDMSRTGKFRYTGNFNIGQDGGVTGGVVTGAEFSTNDGYIAAYISEFSASFDELVAIGGSEDLARQWEMNLLAGNDVLLGSQDGGSVKARMMGGNDFVEIWSGNENFVNGNQGNDEIVLNGGRGRYLGGSDYDRIEVYGAEAGTQVNGNNGRDFITGYVDGVIYRGGADNDILAVSTGTIWGDNGADTFQAIAGEGVAIVQDYTASEDFLKGIAGGSFTLTEQGLSYGVGGDQMLLLAGITDASQVTLI